MEEPDSDAHLWLAHILINTLTGNFSPGILVSVIFIVLLIIISALISGSEVSFFSLNPAQVNYIASKESRLSKIILLLLEKPKRLLATILIANNFVNVGIVILSAFVSGELFDFSKYPVMGFLIEVI
ncbi:MAG: DUF21 domain-containing protein, partial [Bacteroidales bacterium]|nr:DUF21 domain-containing protein [Bacteroidales bacterium]